MAETVYFDEKMALRDGVFFAGYSSSQARQKIIDSLTPSEMLLSLRGINETFKVYKLNDHKGNPLELAITRVEKGYGLWLIQDGTSKWV